MPSTLLLDVVTWDFVVDANNNIAVAAQPYALAQDAASAIQTFLTEVWYDKTVGIDYFNQVFSSAASFAVLKKSLTSAALAVPGVVAAQCFISSISNRGLSGQVQVTDVSGNTSVANFSVVSPQGSS